MGAFPMAGRARAGLVDAMKDAGSETAERAVDVRVFREALYAVEDKAAAGASPPRRLPSSPQEPPDRAGRAEETKAVREALSGWRWI